MEYIISEDCLDSATITHADATGDLRELVRCKDCKHGAYVVKYGMLPFVSCGGVDHDLEWFCADGKKR